MENNQIFEMVDWLKAMQEQKKDLEAQAKALGAEINALDLQLSDAMVEVELDRFSRNGSTRYLKSWLFASPVAGRRDEMIAALKGQEFMCRWYTASERILIIEEFLAYKHYLGDGFYPAIIDRGHIMQPRKNVSDGPRRWGEFLRNRKESHQTYPQHFSWDRWSSDFLIYIPRRNILTV